MIIQKSQWQQRATLWGFNISAWLLCLVLAWQCLSQQHFLYGLWYQWLGIGDTISTYAPHNRHQRGHFVYTTADEHKRLFAELVASINQQGKGLSDLHFQLPAQLLKEHPVLMSLEYRLLTPQEVVHLQDVSRLVSGLKTLGLTACVMAIALLLLIYHRCWQLPSIASALRQQGVVAIAALIMIVLVGPRQVFYWLHEQIFPADHPWFFYYEDSLMTTLMQAPNIFAPITILWLLLSWLLWYVLNRLLQAVFGRFQYLAGSK